MPIKMLRIDDRLIHGQVAAVWTKQAGIEQIIIVNDEVAKDSLQQSVQKMAAPSNVRVSIFAVDEFIHVLKQQTPIKRDTMILFTNPLDVIKTINEGGKIVDTIIVGGMRSKEGRAMINKSVYVNEAEDDAFKQLMQAGIQVILRAVPTDSAVRYEKTERKV